LTEVYENLDAHFKNGRAQIYFSITHNASKYLIQSIQQNDIVCTRKILAFNTGRITFGRWCTWGSHSVQALEKIALGTWTHQGSHSVLMYFSHAKYDTQF